MQSLRKARLDRLLDGLAHAQPRRHRLRGKAQRNEPRNSGIVELNDKTGGQNAAIENKRAGAQNLPVGSKSKRPPGAKTATSSSAQSRDGSATRHRRLPARAHTTPAAR
ncbi:MAG: hypothetical protein N2690_07780, partial [Rhodocyclaceae bacterium]|nr:hypothetical protein [Rhodocyclaceae bacterium]